MFGSHRSRRSSPLVRIGLVSGCLLLLLLARPQAREADTATLSPEVIAVVPYKDTLQITVDLEHLKGKKGGGALSVELLGPTGRSLAKTEVAGSKERPAHFRL